VTAAAVASDRPRSDRLEIVATVLLALAAVATAWSSYQASRWNGEQAQAASRANASRTNAARAAALASSQTQIDVATFIQWVNARELHRNGLADFYRLRFRSEFKPAFAAWLATRPFVNPAAPSTPFAMPSYRLKAKAEADRLEAKGRGGIRAVEGCQSACRQLHARGRALRVGPLHRRAQHQNANLGCAHCGTGARLFPLSRSRGLGRDVPRTTYGLRRSQVDLGFSQENPQWPISANALVFGGFLLLGGRAADMIGRRRMFVAGIVVFTVASLLAGLAWSEEDLEQPVESLGAVRPALDVAA
jgi:hypothetical protein